MQSRIAEGRHKPEQSVPVLSFTLGPWMSVFRSALRLSIQLIEQIRQIVGGIHIHAGLPVALNGRGGVVHRVPDAPAGFDLSHFIAHGRECFINTAGVQPMIHIWGGAQNLGQRL